MNFSRLQQHTVNNDSQSPNIFDDAASSNDDDDESESEGQENENLSVVIVKSKLISSIIRLSILKIDYF